MHIKYNKELRGIAKLNDLSLTQWHAQVISHMIRARVKFLDGLLLKTGI